MSLAQFQSGDRVFQMMQNSWGASLNPILAIPMLSGVQLKGVSLIGGVTNINHLLQRQQQGWFITDINGSSNIYRSQPFNSLTLTLTSSAAVIVDIWCF